MSDELCDYVPSRQEYGGVSCPKCGTNFRNDGPITYSGCLTCEPRTARAAGARTENEQDELERKLLAGESRP